MVEKILEKPKNHKTKKTLEKPPENHSTTRKYQQVLSVVGLFGRGSRQKKHRSALPAANRNIMGSGASSGRMSSKAEFVMRARLRQQQKQMKELTLVFLVGL